MKIKKEHLKSFPIAGFTYYEGVTVFQKLKIGTILKLELEPENKFDPRAVAIYFKDSKLGFVPRSENEFIYKLLRVGYKNFSCYVQRVDETEHPEQQVSVSVFVNRDK